MSDRLARAWRAGLSEMETDHITPWIEGGHTTAENYQMLYQEDNQKKGKVDFSLKLHISTSKVF